METIVQPYNQLLENLAGFLRENEFKPYRDFDNCFEKIIDNDKQKITFRILLNENNPNLFYCGININKILSKQQKSKIFEFINNLAGTYPFLSFHFKEHSSKCHSLYCRLTWFSNIDDTEPLIIAYQSFENSILQDIYPVIIKFLAEV